MRGDTCPYDHGPDPVVVEDDALEKVVRSVFDRQTNTFYGANPPPPGMEITNSSENIKPLGTVTEGYKNYSLNFIVYFSI